MNSELPDDNELIPKNVARALIARAAEMESHAGSRSTLGELRAAVAQVGISPAAFEAAVAEMRAQAMVAAEPARGRWKSAWERLATRSLVRFAPGWLGTLLTMGVASGALFTAVGPREIGLVTIATLAAVTGHALALVLTGRVGDTNRHSGSLQSAIAGALLPFTYAGLQILQVIRSPMTYHSTTVIWFVLSALVTLVIAAVGGRGGADRELVDAGKALEGSSPRVRWWSSLFEPSTRGSSV